MKTRRGHYARYCVVEAIDLAGQVIDGSTPKRCPDVVDRAGEACQLMGIGDILFHVPGMLSVAEHVCGVLPDTSLLKVVHCPLPSI